MLLTCPACRKPNEFDGIAAATCVRCGCDLSRLSDVRLAAARSQAAATRALCDRDWLVALEQAGCSWSLRHTPEAARLAALACGALGRLDELWAWRQRAGSEIGVT